MKPQIWSAIMHSVVLQSKVELFLIMCWPRPYYTTDLPGIGLYIAWLKQIEVQGLKVFKLAPSIISKVTV